MLDDSPHVPKFMNKALTDRRRSCGRLEGTQPEVIRAI